MKSILRGRMAYSHNALEPIDLTITFTKKIGRRTCCFKFPDGSRCGKPGRGKDSSMCKEHHKVYMKAYYEKRKGRVISNVRRQRPAKEVQLTNPVDGPHIDIHNGRMLMTMRRVVPLDVLVDLGEVKKSGCYKKWSPTNKVVLFKVMEMLEKGSPIKETLKVLNGINLDKVMPFNLHLIEKSIERLEEIL